MSKISTFACRLQELLELKGITKAELSRITGINKSSLTHYVKGDWEGKQDAVYAIAKATGVSEAWLMGYDVPMTQKETRKQEIAKKMKNLRTVAGLTQLQVAEKLGITYQTVSDYEQGINTIEPELFLAMCTIYNVDPITVLSPDEGTEIYDALFKKHILGLQRQKKKRKNTPSISDEAMKLAKDYDDLDNYGQRMVRMVADGERARCIEQAKEKAKIEATAEFAGDIIPFRRSYQPASAGTGVFLGPDEFETIYVQKNDLTRRASFGVPVSGDSMEPNYHDGDVLLVERAEDIGIGEVGVFTINGEGYVKERSKGELISLNPTYDPIPMNESIFCSGRVIGILEPDWIVEK